MQQTTQKPLEIETQFLHRLVRKIEKDNGARAVLSRSVVDDPVHKMDAYSIILPLLKDAPPWQRDAGLLIGSLVAMYPQPVFPLDEYHLNFGWSCSKLQQQTTSNGVERRVKLILTCAVADLRSPLTEIIRWMKSKRVAIDYAKLMFDLQKWEHPNRYVQDQWAQSFWGLSDL